MLRAVTVDSRIDDVDRLNPLHPVGAVAALVCRRIRQESGSPMIYVAQSSRRAREISEMVEILHGDRTSAFLPRWDGSAEDGIHATADAMGRRMSVFRWLLDRRKRPAVVVTTVAALLRRVPPQRIWNGLHLEFKVGETIDVDAVRERLGSIGYEFDERVDLPGEAAVRGKVIEIFPAAAPRPCRIEYEDGVIQAIRSFDPATQRSLVSCELLIVDPADEIVQLEPEDETLGNAERDLRASSLAAAYGETETIFDYLPDATMLLEEDVEKRVEDFLAVTDDANFLDVAEWQTAAGPKLGGIVEQASDEGEDAHVPNFAGEQDPAEACRSFLQPLRERGYRVAIAGIGSQLRRRWGRRIARSTGARTTDVDRWSDVLDASGDTVCLLEWPLDEGFLSHVEKVAVIALRDLMGHHPSGHRKPTASAFGIKDDLFGIGDEIVHFDHGVAVLEGLEEVGEGDERQEALRLRYADDATLLVPMNEIGALWRYGGSGENVSLDKLNGDGWETRRNAIVGEITRTAERMTALMQERGAARCAKIEPERVDFERFCARFPYDLTQGQAEAVDDVLADLGSGQPMDRLLCADVGYGKTEVAMRAVAAAVFAGRQAAIVAPTTILARQHLDVFRKRFARHGVDVVLLSRTQSAAEATAAKKALADGSARILVATHAICGKGVEFDDLALVVVDEEQRFGSRHKKALRKLSKGHHVLSMTATPIPRTLQAGFVGLHDLSVITTPPVRRRPVRTRTLPFEDAAIRDVLEGEHERGGKSFVIAPLIEDIEPLAERLATIVPDLKIGTLHGKMTALASDKMMDRFVSGDCDILLATNIVESGVDIPSANTIVVTRPDRFGLAQLHQLRGRVGRGPLQGTMVLATDPDVDLTDDARQRLATLERLNALGAGFDISARDLDLRGAGELLGDEQAGHLRMIGVSLYRRLLERSLRRAQGETVPDEWSAEIEIGIGGGISKDYLPEPESRIEVASSLDRVENEASLGDFRREMADRFGPIPPELATLFDLVALRLRCQTLAIRHLDAGPKAVAATFTRDDADRLRQRIEPGDGDELRWSECRLILERPSDDPVSRWEAIETLLDRIA